MLPVGLGVNIGMDLTPLISLIGIGKRRREQEKLIRTQTQAQKDLLRTQAEAQAKVLQEQRKNLLVSQMFSKTPAKAQKKTLAIAIPIVAILIIAIILWKGR